jgi:hypothetical protein
MAQRNGPYGDGEPLHRTALGLGVGSLLVAVGVAVMVLGLFTALTRYGLAIPVITGRRRLLSLLKVRA